MRSVLAQANGKFARLRVESNAQQRLLSLTGGGELF